MSIQATDWYSVLGGEVSPNVQKRADMAKFGKWLDNAENIRIDMLGGFMNRPGFVYLSETRNVGSKKIKLIPFEYSRTDAWVIELGDNYFSVFNKDSGYVLDSYGNPAKFSSQLSFYSSSDVSYSQVGNFLYIANGVGKPQIIKRITNSVWVMEEFNYNGIPPLSSFNQNPKDKISLSRSTTGFNPNTTFKYVIDSLNYNENTILPFISIIVYNIYGNGYPYRFFNTSLRDLPAAINNSLDIGPSSSSKITASYVETSESKSIYLIQGANPEYNIRNTSINVYYGSGNTTVPALLYSNSDFLQYSGTYPSDSPIEFLRNTKIYSSKLYGSPDSFSKTNQNYFYINLDINKFNSFRFDIIPQGFTFTNSSLGVSNFYIGKNPVLFCYIEDGTLHFSNGSIYVTYSGLQTKEAIYDWFINTLIPKIQALSSKFMSVAPMSIDVGIINNGVGIHFKSYSFACKSVNPSVSYPATFVDSDGSEISSSAYFYTSNVGSPYYTTSSGFAPVCSQTNTAATSSDSGSLYCSYFPTVRITYSVYNSEIMYGSDITTPITNVVSLIRTQGGFDSMSEDDVIAIYNTVPSRTPASGSVPDGGTSASPTTLFDGYSNGNIRLVTNGNWKGTIKLMYSDSTTNNQYIDLDTIYSESTLKPNNANRVYEIDTPDDTVLVKLISYGIINEAQSSQTGLGPLSLTFVTDSFQNIIYCRIIQKSSDTKVFAEIISGEFKCLQPSLSDSINTDIWRFGAWSPTFGYPKYVFFVQNRIGFARTQTTPQGVWLSRIDEHNDFRERVKYLDDNPVSIVALGLQQHEVTGVQSLKDFFIFTLGQELGIYSDTTITQKNKQLMPFSYYGSEPIESQVSGSRLLFVEKGGVNVRELVYSFQSSNYDSNDMTLLIPHLLSNRKIISTSKLTQKEKEVLFLTDDGIILVFKHLPEQEIYAWTHWKHSKYKITNIVSIPDSNGNQILYIVCEDENGKKHIEFMPYTRNSFFADTIKTTQAQEYIDSVSGDIKYLVSTGYPENTELVVRANHNSSAPGIVYKLKTDSSGNIYFNENPGLVSFGFKYSSILSFISPIIGSQLGNSSSLKKSIFKVYYDYVDSNCFSIGVNNNRFSKPNFSVNPNANIEDYNTKVYSGSGEVLLECSFDKNNKLTFKQEEPFQMYVTNVKALVDYGS